MPRTSLVPTDTPIMAGLLAAGAPVPLEGVSVEATVTGEFARVTIAQRYRNREAQPIEAVYVFPLDEGAAVCAFEAVVADVLYVGQVTRREDAFRTYDDAMMAGHGAYLLDEERPDVFTASIGNLPPGAEVAIRVTYVTEVPMDGAALRFTLPTTVSPRYAPAEDRVGVGRPPAEVLNPPVAWTVPYGLNLTVEFQMPGAVTRIESPSHPISTRLNHSGALVTLAQAGAALDRDVVILIEAMGLDAPHAVLERTPDGRTAAALVFHPSFETVQAPSDVVFLVDRSGSMQGSSITEVRNALQLCLRSMVAGSRFDIVGFGSTFASLFGGSRAYDDTSLAEASRHVEALEANLGGTEILPALKAVLERPHAGLPRQIVLLTDGEVTNADEVIALVARHAVDTRVFTFGIGAGASAYLVRGVARAANGASEFIAPGERAEAKILRQFTRVLAPALTDVRVNWGGLEVVAAPTHVPAVFAGGTIIVYGWIDDVRAAVVTLSATGPRGPISYEVAVAPSLAVPGTTMSTLAARARIREIEARQADPDERGSRQRDRRAASDTAEIVRLAMRYGLVSRETSFVAVERREHPMEGPIALRRIPVALTHGWGGIGDHDVHDLHTVSALATVRASKPADFSDAHWLTANAPDRETTHSALLPRSRAKAPTRSLFRRAMDSARGAFPSGATRPLDRVVTLQRADGTWALTPELGHAVGVPWNRLSVVPADLAGQSRAQDVWATLVALAWLERHAADTRDEWQLLARKADVWIAAIGSADERRRWESLAAGIVAPNQDRTP
jgi:hypothetical protein